MSKRQLRLKIERPCFWNAAAPKEGFACGCDLPVRRVGRGARGPYRKSAAGRHLAKVLGPAPGNSITKPPACYKP